MAIKKYFSIEDNTITNAFEENLSVRGTGSNMGQSDILEVFSIYGQQSTSSAELSRVLIQFDIGLLSDHRASGEIPASGSVSFFLKMCNAEHTKTLPRNYNLQANAISVNWEEGNGLDMDNYTDLTHNFTGSNWIHASGNPSAASLSDAIDTSGISAGDKFTLRVPTSAGGDGVLYTFLFDTTTNIDADENSNTYGISTQRIVDDADAASIIVKAINGEADSKYKYGANNHSDGSSFDIPGISATSDGTKVTLTMDTNGPNGNVANVLAAVTNFAGDKLLESAFTGGKGPWASEGGDWYTDSSSSFSQHFKDGDEDLEINVTTLVEQWVNSDGNVLGSKPNYGFIIKLAPENEASSSANSSGARFSYFTKKFFSRSTEFFFKRPAIEARWNSSRKDNRGNLYYSASYVPPSDNLNTLFLYNYSRGLLRDIADSSINLPVLNLYYASASVPEGDARFFRDSSNNAVDSLVATRVSTGIYKAVFTVTSSVVNSTYPYLVDQWTFSGSTIQTGAPIEPLSPQAENYDVSRVYVLSMPNLQSKYTNKKTERLRLFVRDKGWSPNVFTKVNSNIKSKIIDSASYQIMRVVDQKVVIPYGTGSDNYTMLSYDVSGNYFDFDMSLLESGYTYSFKYSFYDDAVGSYREQPYLFKFKVESDEY